MTADRTEATSSPETKTPPSEVTRARMVKQRRRDTAPELAVRRLLHARGWRYRVDVAPLPGLRRRADIVFTRRRVAVYIDGCYWHRCPVHGTVPKSNTSWWMEKLDGNVARDRDTDLRLAAAGWTVLRAWEHEPADEVVIRVESVLQTPTRKSEET